MRREKKKSSWKVPSCSDLTRTSVLCVSNRLKEIDRRVGGQNARETVCRVWSIGRAVATYFVLGSLYPGGSLSVDGK